VYSAPRGESCAVRSLKLGSGRGIDQDRRGSTRNGRCSSIFVDPLFAPSANHRRSRQVDARRSRHATCDVLFPMPVAERSEEGRVVRRVFALLRFAPALCGPRAVDPGRPPAIDPEPLASSGSTSDPECVGRKVPFRVDVPALFLERAAEFCAGWRTPKRDSLEPPTAAFERESPAGQGA
jgi:hypothetical protein